MGLRKDGLVAQGWRITIPHKIIKEIDFKGTHVYLSENVDSRDGRLNVYFSRPGDEIDYYEVKVGRSEKSGVVRIVIPSDLRDCFTFDYHDEENEKISISCVLRFGIMEIRPRNPKEPKKIKKAKIKK